MRRLLVFAGHHRHHHHHHHHRRCYSSPHQHHHRIVSYNVLSPNLCSSAYFPHTPCRNEDDFSSSTRLRRVKRKLDPHAERSAVLCLQEVSRSWMGSLVSYFESRDYAYASALSGGPRNGYMGSVLAWPRRRYRPREIDTTRVADTVRWPHRHKPRKTNTKTTTMMDDVLSFIERVLRRPAADAFDTWAVARERHNAMVLARLEDIETSRDVVFGTYHMPCLFGSDAKVATMVAHALMSARHAQSFAGNDPLVLAGDFNVLPDTSAYAVLRDGGLDPAHPQAPRTGEGSGSPRGWDASTIASGARPMRSAYAVKNGGEPAFTNYAWPRPAPEPFLGTLDYVWLSEHWDVESVLSTPPIESIANVRSYPTPDEPSDHVPIGADLACR